VFSTTRLEAFSDGVYAIAITLLILNVVEATGGSPLDEFLSAWPSYVGYVVSFLTIGVAWIGHAALTDDLDHVDSLFLRLNLLLLMVVVFLPFPTSLVTAAFGDREAERVAVTVYGVTLLCIRLMGIALDRYSAREHLYARDRDETELLRARRKNAVAVLLYVVAIVVGLLLPGVAVTVYFAIAVYLVVPFREVGRLLRARRSQEPTP
jgi:uncharacterized membrane protein